MKKKRVGKYYWDDQAGLCFCENHHQQLQILVGPASHKFRKKCGLILVKFLNEEFPPVKAEK